MRYNKYCVGQISILPSNIFQRQANVNVMTLMFIGQIDLFSCKSVILKVMLIKEIDFLIVQKIYIDYVENYKQQFLSIARLQSTTVDNVQ